LKKAKKRDLKYPRAVKVVTLFMVLVSVAIAGLATYVSVGSGFLASNLGTTLGSIMGSSGGNGTSPFQMSNTTTSVKAWMLFPINNTGPVGLDINNLAVNVKLTYDANGTTLDALSLVGSIPFGESKLANITLIDTTPFMFMGLGNSSITMAISFAMAITLPKSWGLFALKISDLEFGFTMNLPGGFMHP